MPPKQTALLAKLDAVEAEMKRLGIWSDPLPAALQADIAAGRIRSWLDVKTFEWWLQGVFLPNARARIRENKLPKTSQVGLMAQRQWEYHSSVPERHPLMHLLFEFDRLVEHGA